jgi:hypothetical protein
MQDVKEYVKEFENLGIDLTEFIHVAIPESKDETMETPPPSDESMGVQPGQTQMLNKYLKYKNNLLN